jgi:phosphate transport system protein
MSNHIVEDYDEELRELELLIAYMGNDVSTAFETTCNDLVKGDKGSADDVIEHDKDINAQELKINVKAQNLLALRSPMASDLRFVLTSIQVAGNLERVGDLTKNIAKINRKMGMLLPTEIATSLKEMSSLALAILQASISAYNNKEEEQTQRIFEDDVTLDKQNKELSKVILKELKRDENNLEDLAHLLFVTRHLERVGDHAKNIAEATIYMCSGEMNRFDFLEDNQDV